ncbi:hypothetical protein [Thalassoporum mexicanum]|nr:hypothetical protein [Pseudanabaena sp. PCC 7367]
MNLLIVICDLGVVKKILKSIFALFVGDRHFSQVSWKMIRMDL